MSCTRSSLSDGSGSAASCLNHRTGVLEMCVVRWANFGGAAPDERIPSRPYRTRRLKIVMPLPG